MAHQDAIEKLQAVKAAGNVAGFAREVLAEVNTITLRHIQVADVKFVDAVEARDLVIKMISKVMRRRLKDDFAAIITDSMRLAIEDNPGMPDAQVCELANSLYLQRIERVTGKVADVLFS